MCVYREAATDLAALAEAKGTKYLLMTGHPEEMQMLEQQGLPYLSKPFRAQAFIEHVNQICDRD